MIELTIEEIIQAISASCEPCDARAQETIKGVSTDTRSVKTGDILFALVGENMDAHDYLGMLSGNIPAALVASKPEAVPESYTGCVLIVDDTLRALQELSSFVCAKVAPHTIAITGSVGKTTLKDILAQISSSKYKTVATSGNYNNHIGVPLTIFEIEADTEVLILEMGMNHAGEIRRLVEIARPEISIIANVMEVHRENFDSDDGILKAKMEVADFLGEDSTLVVNGDDEGLRQAADIPYAAYAIITAGSSKVCDFRVRDSRLRGNDRRSGNDTWDENSVSFVIEYGEEAQEFTVPIPGGYIGTSVALAVAAASAIGISLRECAEALTTIKRTSHRLELLINDNNGIKIIDDTYNASPESMKSALDYLAKVAALRRIAVLADMYELGKDAPRLHREVGVYAAESGVDVLVTVGELAKHISEGSRPSSWAKSQDPCPLEILHFATREEAISYLKKNIRKGDVYLVKGSHATKMQEVVEELYSDAQ
jgi:UDP-N-acetylmuramoyl-tripeptide--D-alanyl-D-alanine ligase